MTRLTITCLLLLTLAFASTTEAQQASRSTFLKLMDVQKLWEKENYPQALAELEVLVGKTDGYDHAVANQYLAHTCVLADCRDRARTALEAALSVRDLPQELAAELNLFYAQIVLADEDFELARTRFENWMRLTNEKLLPSQLFSAAYANYITEHYVRADQLLERAITSHRTPQESWYRLRYETLFKLKRYKAAEDIAVDLLTSHPNDEDFWRMLANHYLRLEQGPKALAILTIAHDQELLDDPDDLRRIVTLYGYVEVPERAARLLDELMQDAVLKSDFETLKQLGELWLLSRERGRAIQVLEKAAEVAPDGEVDVLLGSIYFEEENWPQAHDAFQRAIARGAADGNERLHLLAGLSAFRAGMSGKARTALQEALKSDELRSQARSLLNKLDAAET